MIFGKRIPASVYRQPVTTGKATTIFPSNIYPTFTVRQFLGTIFQTLRPETHVGQIFGNDPMQLRVVFADWPVGLNDDFPIQPQDTLVVNGKDYVVQGAKFFPGDHMEIYVRVVPKPLQ